MADALPDYDALVVGAGFAGMHALKSLRDKLGLKVRVFEAGAGVGGTWYWNRYPGARCDSDAYIYCFTWDKQLLQEWEWSPDDKLSRRFRITSASNILTNHLAAAY